MVDRFIPENDGDANVGPPVSATDPEGDAITYTLDGDDKALFIVETTGQLKTLADGLNHETNPTATVEVIATTADKKTHKTTVTITVLDVSEAPMFSEPAPITRSIPEGDAGRSVPGGPVLATDPDGGAPTHTLKPSVDARSFEIDSLSGELTTAVDLDFEADRNGDLRLTRADWTYMVTVMATDAGGLYSEAEVTITVTNEPEAPMFPDVTGTLFVYEGPQGARVHDPDGVLIATDGDGDPLTYTHDGRDAATFAINMGTGQLTTTKALTYVDDVANAFEVTVKVKDATHPPVGQSVTIDLRNVTEENNVAPKFYTDASYDAVITRATFKATENQVGEVGLVYADDQRMATRCFTRSAVAIPPFSPSGAMGLYRARNRSTLTSCAATRSG